MTRRLDKIDKELGYCDIKLEKARRLKQQCTLLAAEVEALERCVTNYQSAVRGLQNLQYNKISQQIALEKARTDKAGPFFFRAREDFISAGILELFLEERETLLRELETARSKLESFLGFGEKRSILAEERGVAVKSLAPSHSSRIRKIPEMLQRTEVLWNSLTEDALNFDEGIFFLARTVDYMKSVRMFLIGAKGSFDIESWVESGYSTDIFRHSNIGRAKEMIAGANRNLKLAQKEFFCVRSLKIRLGGLESVMVSFLGAIFEDIFLDARLGRSIAIAEDGLVHMEKSLSQVRQKRETLHTKLECTERARAQLCARSGGAREGRISTS